MAKLSVNLNKIALLRNSRGRDFPNPLEFGRMALKCGAHGLTVHPRPDERHAKFSDLKPLKQVVQGHPEAEFNVEGYPSSNFLEAVIQVKAHQCTLVPDAPDALTSNAGWDFAKNEETLRKVTLQLKQCGVRTSLFLDPFTFSARQLESLKVIKCDRIELYTESFAHAFGTPKEKEILQAYADVAKRVSAAGFGVNAGHDLNQQNLGRFVNAVPETLEVSIGHALIVEALIAGFEPTILGYLKILKS